MNDVVWVCPKCKNKINITQHIEGFYHIWGVDKNGNSTEGRYGDNMKYGKYRCENCTLSSWDFSEMIKRKEELK